ncbi:sensor histidine kinase [uncultured Corynebacterium sp.]|uniref:sensor histidine kinase n=1 Tax=uncultured Corynebacterium sp. TaxID=159447 RepID=UPI0025F2E647|nr:sensor histidine kinase [uncultured Corynebacterium sp.]
MSAPSSPLPGPHAQSLPQSHAHAQAQLQPQPPFVDAPSRSPWPGVLLDALIATAVLGAVAGVDNSYVFNPVLWMPNQEPPPPEWKSSVYFAWVIAAWVLAVIRRIRPRASMVGLPALLLVHLFLFPTTYASFAVTSFAMFHLGHRAPRKWRWPAWLAVIAGTSVAGFVRGEALLLAPEVAIVVVPVALLVLGFFWLLGVNYRRRDEELAALRDRAELAAIAERTRIAREMHDIVAHSLTAVIAQADGGRFIAAKHPDKAVEALENIAGTARDSLGQMRQLLSVLRDPAGEEQRPSLDDAPSADETDAPADVPYAPMPGLDALPQLIAEATRSGLRVEVTETGERPEVGATMQLTIYRIVQEALTNAVKHAGAVAVDVTIAWRKRECLVTVRNDRGPLSRDAGTGASDAGGGRGITGMRERVSLHGGSLDVDDAPGGFTVAARLPRH